MNKYISISLLVILSAPHLLRLGIMVSWKIDQAYITANFCENKEKPALKCDGKCYLKKQLAKTEDQSPAIPASSEKVPVVKSFECPPFLIADSPFLVYSDDGFPLLDTAFPGVLLSYHFTFITSLFQPPDSSV